MKYIILLLSFLLIKPHLLQSQPADNIVYLNKIDTLMAENYTLSKRVEILNETNNAHDSAVNSWGIWFTVLSIIVAIGGIAFPLYGFLTIIKPAKDIIDNVDKMVLEKVDSYLSDKHFDNFEKILILLDSNDTQDRNEGLQRLNRSDLSLAGKDQHYVLFELLVAADNGTIFQKDLATALNKIHYPRLLKFYDQLLRDNNQHLFRHGWEYMIFEPYERVASILHIIISMSQAKFVRNMAMILSTAMFLNRDFLDAFFNDKKLIDMCDDDSLKKIDEEVSLQRAMAVYSKSYARTKYREAQRRK